MRCFLNLLVAVAILAAAVVGLAQSRPYNLGTPLSQDEIRSFDGEGGAAQRLVLGGPGNPYRGPFKDTEKTATSYYPYPTIAWDYINRAMPANNPGSLTPDEVYALVAFLFYRNGIIQETDVLDAKSLPKIEMPNRNGFVPAVPVWPPDPKKPSWF